VAIAALVHEGRILLIRRKRGDYPGLCGLPGGKIERDEHLSEAATREIREESGIEASFIRYLGCVSEHLVEEGRVARHFLLHVCALEPRSVEILTDAEGTLRWCALDGIGGMRGEIIPSDFMIIERMVAGGENGYYECVIEKTGEAHVLKRFE
jgi:ADP-ribose pyrophosphatase YjhB (NUDIX family)